jgi:hypothetical protein
MKRAIVLLIPVLSTVMLILAYSSLAREQGRGKRTISRIYLHSASITPPVEYENIRVRGRDVKFSSMFEKGNDKLQKPVNP